MAAYSTEKNKFGREPFYYVEIDIDATTYRFCSNRSPLPQGVEAIPCLDGAPQFSPCKVDPQGGLGVRGTVSLSFSDFPDYTIFGTASSPLNFWPVWRANYPYYQGATVRAYSGYIADFDLFDVNAFQARHYVIESFSYSNGKAQIQGQDPLKLANNARAEYPPKNTGTLLAAITGASGSLTLEPAGVGDDEYPTGSFKVRINEAVLQVSRVAASDVLTISNVDIYSSGETDHSAADGVQFCWEPDDYADVLVEFLLTTGAGVSSSYINSAEWQAERELYLPSKYQAVVTEPVGVNTLLKELGEQAPHRIYWDERIPAIKFYAIKPPPEDSLCMTDEGNLIADSVTWSDNLDMRISYVIVAYEQKDPAKKLDEFSNYRQPYVRIDPDSTTDYGSNRIKRFNCRWINDKAGAILLAARWGRRFSAAPLTVGFSLDAKDSDIWTGDSVQIDTRTIVETNGDRKCLPLEIMSVQEAGKFKYSALEYSYGQSLPQDESVDSGSKVYILSGNYDQLKDNAGTVRTLEDLIFDKFGVLDAADDVIIIFDGLAVAGSSDNTLYAVDTGDFSELTTPPLIQLNSGALIVGKGGNGARVGEVAPDMAGGAALMLNSDIRLSNNGIIGGGGGGGNADIGDGDGTAEAAGGGGAGYFNGSAGAGTSATGNKAATTQAVGGTNTTGGAGGIATNDAIPEPSLAYGGDGGDLGAVGGSGGEGAGGAAGAAIALNGYTITYINTGTILGTVS